MKRLKYLLSAALLLFIMAGVPVYIAASQQNEENTGEAKQVDIMFTHDTHSHLDSFLTQENGENMMVGGFARIKTLIDEKKAENADAFLFDAGDFSMGTLVQTIFMEEAAELRMLGALGCDVTTFGNHEFDYRSQGLAKMLKSAAANTDRVPAIALCNVDWERMEKDGLTDEQQMLKEAFEGYGISDYVIVQKGNIKIAVIGVFGEDSLKCAPTCVLKFKSAPEAVRETIESIRANESGVDMIVCVSHSGTNKDIKRSEDEILAKEVPELDVGADVHACAGYRKRFRDCDESVCLDSIVDGDLDIRDGDRLLPVYEQKGDQASDAGLCDDVVQFGVHFRPVYGTCVQCADSGQ